METASTYSSADGHVSFIADFCPVLRVWRALWGRAMVVNSSIPTTDELA